MSPSNVAQAAQTPDSASPAAERVRYVSSGTYSLSYWNGGGGFYNNQTTGTVAVSYDQNGGVVHRSTAYAIAPAGWDWGPVRKIKNC
ncbi:hypothetical protein [Streptomyces acidiscabies]|uniref:Uncharacterized protein n=1 Tax=Streptomyces acidiscabies TaxID=42234 RepID=A0A0L0JR39_9ACTN|nr:hypothetical protein [Streptomyces acidiscabies]KND28041.1 hypothetical protein IQ63_34150 [Streptomyces acidiscabies]